MPGSFVFFDRKIQRVLFFKPSIRFKRKSMLVFSGP